MHSGVIHLLANLLAVLSLGVGLERAFGFCRTALIYLLSGLIGTAMSAIFLPQVSAALGPPASYPLDQPVRCLAICARRPRHAFASLCEVPMMHPPASELLRRLVFPLVSPSHSRTLTRLSLLAPRRPCLGCLERIGLRSYSTTVLAARFGAQAPAGCSWPPSPTSSLA